MTPAAHHRPAATSRQNTYLHQETMMTSRSQQQTVLTQDGQLPDDLDWELDITVNEHHPGNNLVLKDLAWKQALYYDGRDITGMLCIGGIYHQRFSEHLLVGIKYDFEATDDHRILAHGTLHPADEQGGDYFTDESSVIITATVEINPRSDRTAQAIREYIQQNYSYDPDENHRN